MKQEKLREWCIDILVDVVSGLFLGIGTYSFAAAFKFPMVGFSGIALILYQLTGLPVGVGTLLLNIPVGLACYRVLGREFLIKSIKSLIITSVMMDLVAMIFPVYQGEYLLAALCMGVLLSIGYSIVFMRGSSTGGSDFLIMLLRHYHPHLTLGRITLVIDSMVIVLGVGMVSRSVDSLIYGLLISYIVAALLDRFMDGLTEGKLIMIICHNPREMAEEIVKVIKRGSTFLKAQGSYTGEERDVVMCACRPKEVHHIRQSAKKIDPTSFVIILNSNEVAGEGFRNL